MLCREASESKTQWMTENIINAAMLLHATCQIWYSWPSAHRIGRHSQFPGDVGSICASVAFWGKSLATWNYDGMSIWNNQSIWQCHPEAPLSYQGTDLCTAGHQRACIEHRCAAVTQWLWLQTFSPSFCQSNLHWTRTGLFLFAGGAIRKHSLADCVESENMESFCPCLLPMLCVITLQYVRMWRIAAVTYINVADQAQ